MPSRRQVDDRLRALVSTLDDAVALLDGFALPGDMVPPTDNPASLLEQCLALCAQVEASGPEPVRTLHHFACTGGSLISKCLAAMPNTQLLSEVDPLSTMLDAPDGKPRFAPSDMISLVRQSERGASQDLVVEMFLADLRVVYEECSRVGQRLVLRDHAHGHYCLNAVAARPGLREIVAMRFPVVSALTVRHPLDSYLALHANGWIQHAPPTIDEYCRRYLAFLSDHSDVPVVRYEDVVAAPKVMLKQLCGHLRLSFREDFVDLFDAVPMTGDSGRVGGVIGLRARRAVGGELQSEVMASRNYRLLLQQLDYDS